MLMILLYINSVFFDFEDMLFYICVKVIYDNGLCEVFFDSCIT